MFLTLPALSRALSVCVMIGVCAGSAHAQYEWMATVNLARLHQHASGSNVLIGQIESGTPRTNHVALDGNVAQSKVRFIRSSEGVRPNLDHATHVAGIIAGRKNSDGAGFTGAAPNATLASSNWIDPAGAKVWEDSFLDSMSQFMLVGAVPKIINMSAGSRPTDAAAERQGVQIVADWVAQQGVLFVAAAGNQGTAGTTLGSPATGYNVLTVGATGETAALKNYNKVADYSSRGPATDWGGSRMKPDLVAPGSRIYSPRQDAMGGNFNRFSDQADDGSWNSGTSFAAPIVSGVAGCLFDFGQTHALSTDRRVMRAVLMNSTSKRVENDAGVRWDKIADLGKGNASISLALGTGQLDAGQAWEQYRAGQTHVAEGAIGEVPQLGFDFSKVTAAGLPGGPSYRTNKDVRRGSYMTSTVCWDRKVKETGVTDGSQTDWSKWKYDTLNNLDITISKFGSIGTVLQQSNATDGTSEHSVFKAPTRDKFYTNVISPGAVTGDAPFGIGWEWAAAPAYTKQYNGGFTGNSHGNYLDDGWFRAGLENPPAPTITKPTFVADNGAAWALKVESSIEAAQEVFNPLDTFRIDFDYGFNAGAAGTAFYAMFGSLNLFELNGVAAGFVTPDGTNTNKYKHFSLTLNRTRLAPLTDQFLDLKFGAIGGPDSVWIDNVVYVPTPGAMTLGLAGMILAVASRRR